LNSGEITHNPWNNFEDISSVIAVNGYKIIVAIVNVEKGDADLVEFRWYMGIGSYFVIEPKYAADQETQSDRTHKRTIAADMQIPIELPTGGAIKNVKLQAKFSNGGAPATTAKVLAGGSYALGR
jgi:hypothetical protein